MLVKMSLISLLCKLYRYSKSISWVTSKKKNLFQHSFTFICQFWTLPVRFQSLHKDKVVSFLQNLNSEQLTIHFIMATEIDIKIAFLKLWLQDIQMDASLPVLKKAYTHWPTPSVHDMYNSYLPQSVRHSVVKCL